ncbi:GNAT family N-acetyltransferase [Oerskovia sp. KBS0722]|uniref:GNAT family N-acetyltransferase n=1 Tax=Oerskovia sp. KBS0722 TaxID=1179673 RepID=UPI001FED722C|nr:GNAT family N-acetyltransferase [Oerskovia sp. KBS0722]
MDRTTVPTSSTLLDDLARDPASREEMLDRLCRVTAAPGQDRFVSSAAEIVALAEADAGRHLLVALRGEEVAGLGVLHPGGAPAEVVALLDGPATGDVVLFRGFLVDRAHQGQGVGTAVAAALPALAARLAERLGRGPFEVVVLTVNEENAAGLRAYARGGFVDRGRYLGGDAGPQRVMAHAL